MSAIPPGKLEFRHSENVPFVRHRRCCRRRWSRWSRLNTTHSHNYQLGTISHARNITMFPPSMCFFSLRI